MARKLVSGLFWVDAVERTVGAAASASLALLTANGLGVLDVDWGAIGSVAGMAAIVSLLKSLVAGSTGDPETAGFTTGR
ncbi:holin [Herbidospora daliensis]|uniref:holin n=1 Tax=Herbidospora daliensis TaxID=295585 RepID=UPI000785C839|nr:holin [Herbidospora daliensis]